MGKGCPFHMVVLIHKSTGVFKLDFHHLVIRCESPSHQAEYKAIHRYKY